MKTIAIELSEEEAAALTKVLHMHLHDHVVPKMIHRSEKKFWNWRGSSAATSAYVATWKILKALPPLTHTNKENAS